MHVSIMHCHHLLKVQNFFFSCCCICGLYSLCLHAFVSIIPVLAYSKAKHAVKWKHDSICYADKRWIIVDWSLRKWYLILKFRVIPTRLNKWKYTFGTVDFTCTISQFTQRHTEDWNGQRVVNDPSRLLTSHYSPQHWSLHLLKFSINFLDTLHAFSVFSLTNYHAYSMDHEARLRTNHFTNSTGT